MIDVTYICERLNRSYSGTILYDGAEFFQQLGGELILGTRRFDTSGS